MGNAGRSAQVRADFIEKIGLIAQGEGLPRTAGRLFGLLVYDGKPIAFGDLAERLQASRGGISSSVRILEERGLVKRTSRAGERQDYFQLAANPYATMLDGARKRTTAAHAEIIQTIQELPESETDVRARLEAYADFYGAIDGALEMALNRLNAKAKA